MAEAGAGQGFVDSQTGLELRSWITRVSREGAWV